MLAPQSQQGIRRMHPAPGHSFTTAIEQAHGRQLRRFLSSRLRNATADVPDVFQEVFLRLLRIKDHAHIRNPQAYLYTVATHVLRQYSQQRSVRPEMVDPLLERLHSATAPDPAEGLEIEERLEQIHRDLNRLSPRAYATLVMYRCEGMTLEEIGRRLGVSHVMVRKYLSRAVAYCEQQVEAVD